MITSVQHLPNNQSTHNPLPNQLLKWMNCVLLGLIFLLPSNLSAQLVLTPRVSPEVNDYRSVAYGNGLFVAVARTGTNRIATSEDGINWVT